MLHILLRFSYHLLLSFSFFFFNDTATTEIYTLSLHDALPISPVDVRRSHRAAARSRQGRSGGPTTSSGSDRKSTRLNSSHPSISYAVFCLKKKKNKNKNNLELHIKKIYKHQELE